MQLEDLFLTVEEPKNLDGSFHRKRRYSVKNRSGLVLGIEDLAARIGRKPASVYQLLKHLPVGIHGVNFQDIIRKSAERRYHKKAVDSKILMATSHGKAVHGLIAYAKHEAGCAVERHILIEARAAAAMDRWLEDWRAWQQAENTRKLRRAEGEQVPVVQPPVRPTHAVTAAPGCDCGRDAAIDAIRATLGECQIQENTNGSDELGAQ